jgi:hypothetical protein
MTCCRSLGGSAYMPVSAIRDALQTSAEAFCFRSTRVARLASARVGAGHAPGTFRLSRDNESHGDGA